MNGDIFPVAFYNKDFNKYLAEPFCCDVIYQSYGLEKHVKKRHPECVPYLSLIPDIISSPDYIGVNPNETGKSFELVKVIDENIQIGIKLDMKRNYLYVATLHTITAGKLRHGIQNSRLKKIDR